MMNCVYGLEMLNDKYDPFNLQLKGWSENMNRDIETYYDVLLRDDFGYLNHFWTACFYILAIILIGFHLKHGFESAFKSLGITKSSNYSLISKISFIFWGVVPLGFIIIIVAIQMKYIQ